MNSSLLEFLSQTMIFQGLSAEQLAELAGCSIAQSYKKGEILFHQGDEGSGFFIVRSGRVKVFKLSAEGKEQILHIFGEGDHFAEVPALDGECFPASAATLEKTDVLFFPRQAFLQLLEQRPTLAINLLKSFARHLRMFSHLVDNLALREVPAQLASYLLDLSEQANKAELVDLDLPKGQLAARLGTIPETLSRMFAKLGREGLIEIEGSKVKLLDRVRLNQLAGR
ncbi:Crp/Fnr family transcriptional regulator [Leptolyngbya sp. FACHB-17]|uniref:Crp/Fnr family transcriptional regulator n=1 Tax=unclassified Leptolyngbya TaxID=2650499 RepID=UPI00168091A3|nr:Crp/Fnr family transcriptional regulator [Leptolyngbya sp. FACHB-17]MBD2082919.1 Crp/Fnr family transcriptional regulator [Leptolyngbya sp. FACHB-17]